MKTTTKKRKKNDRFFINDRFLNRFKKNGRIKNDRFKKQPFLIKLVVSLTTTLC